MKTSNHSSIKNYEHLIDGDYLDVYKTSEGVLVIIWRHRVNQAVLEASSSFNTIQITNKDGTTTNLNFLTIFDNVNSIVREFILPLDVESIALTQQASPPSGGPM